MSEGARNWLGFSAMCVAMFMAILDIQVVASALVVMGKALHVGTDYLSWLQNSYLTSEIVAIPLTGFLTRSFGLRNLFAGATLCFTFASLGCALSNDFVTLIVLRVIQGFFGGMLIPSVFSAIFMLIPQKQQVHATTFAGIAAMLAPTLGPLIGGYLAERYSWHWIFLINIVPGIAAAIVVAAAIRKEKTNWNEFREIDWLAIFMMSASLACLELLLKQGPFHHWRGLEVYLFEAGAVITGLIAIARSLTHARPFVNLHEFRNLRFTTGCFYNFVLGAGLYGSTYLLAIFLGLVRGHSPFEIGEIMMVAGGAQLVVAGFAAWAETRYDPRLLTLLGFALFGLGLFVNGFSTRHTDFNDLVLPQVLRGAALMFCLLPATRIALGSQAHVAVADASGLFNLLRNLGGAIGIAGVDTILEERTPEHVNTIVKHLVAGDPNAARLVGLPTAGFHNVPMGPIDDLTKAIVRPLVEKTALVQAFNEAWFALALLFLLSLFLIPLLRPRPQSGHQSVR